MTGASTSSIKSLVYAIGNSYGTKKRKEFVKMYAAQFFSEGAYVYFITTGLINSSQIIPMMNPDGVYLGNYRGSLLGELWHAKKSIQKHLKYLGNDRISLLLQKCYM